MGHFEELSSKLAENKVHIEAEFKNIVKLTTRLFDLQHEILTMYSWTFHNNIQATNETTKILFTACYKNIHAFYASIDMNLQGLFGSSRIIMRYIFEYLMIAKYCSISKDINLIKNWENGLQISMSSNIFKKINKPETIELEVFWGTLCKYTHATIYSQQIGVELERNQDEILPNFVILAMLLEMNYHLVNSHLINNSMKYYFNDYSDDKTKEKLKELKQEMRDLLKTSKATMMKDQGKKIIRKYVLKWEVKE